MIAFDDALRKTLTGIQPLETTTVSLQEALGRVAAEQILASTDVVSFTRSAMDGYAIRSAECANAERASCNSSGCWRSICRAGEFNLDARNGARNCNGRALAERRRMTPQFSSVC
jgi:hypothetical protein